LVTRTQQIAIAGVFVALCSLLWYISTTEASIDYWMDMPQKQIWIQDEHHFSIHYKNGGGADGMFNLILKFTNVTLSLNTEKPYTIKGSSVSMTFLLHKSESGEKIIYFIINKDAVSFSIELTSEKSSIFDFEKFNPIYPTKINYKWSNQKGCFELSD
jgi:hypothetical protein